MNNKQTFWARVNRSGVGQTVTNLVPTPCWDWRGGVDGDGYGKFYIGGSVQYAHRFSYELVYGKIPDGLEIDHLCKNKHCVNPIHLEAVTKGINAKRNDHSSRLKVHCPSGHELTPENTYIWRGHHSCWTCLRAGARERYAYQKGVVKMR